MKINEDTIRGLLGYLINKEDGEELLHYICKCATTYETYGNEEDWLFRHAALTAKDILPASLRVSLWCDWCYRRESLDFCHPTEECISSSQPLIDDVNVRLRYCQRNLKGHKFLRNIDSLRHETPMEMKWVAESAARDYVPMFSIEFSARGGKFKKDIVWELTKINSTWCLLWLMHDCKVFFRDFPVKEMLCFACANMRDEMGTPVVEYLARRFPQKVSSCIGDLGNNPFWYLLHNKRIAWWREDCGMVQALAKAGCDPDALNHLGLSFRNMTDNLTQEQRMELEQTLKNKLDNEEIPY